MRDGGGRKAGIRGDAYVSSESEYDVIFEREREREREEERAREREREQVQVS